MKIDLQRVVILNIPELTDEMLRKIKTGNVVASATPFSVNNTSLLTPAFRRGPLLLPLA